MIRCPQCMKVYEEGNICPFCGYDTNTEPKEIYHLRTGTILNGKYIIGIVLGFGGFGVVYKCWDYNLNRVVAVKEYFPTIYINRESATNQVSVFDKKNEAIFEKGKREFLQEARNIAKFNTHPNIVHIYDYFEENGTAYFVMEYLEGLTLRDYIRDAKSNGLVIELESALTVTKYVLEALKETHREGIIHRDIKPGNIYILQNGSVKLFDFGAARFADEEHEKTRTVILTPGYAPPEQYQVKSKQGPYTDIYAVGALLYEMITGIKLEESINRKVEDLVEEPRCYNNNIPMNINNAVMRALAIQPEIRFQTAEEFAKALVSPKQVRNVKKELRHRKRIRNLRILGLFAMIGLLVVVCVKQYFAKYHEAVLADATVELWAPSIHEDIQATYEDYQTMLEEFRSDNPQITVEVKIIGEDEYLEVLAEALKNGNGPDVFDSSGLGQEYHTYYESLQKLIEYKILDLNEYYFLKNYVAYFPDQKQMPLTFDVPVLYKNGMMDGLENSEEYDKYCNNSTNFLGTVKDYEAVQTDMAGIYEIEESIDPSRDGEFLNIWSVNAASADEEKSAAIRILYYFLSDAAQEVLALKEEQGLPLNKNIWNIYVGINSDFEYLTDMMNDVPMRVK